MSRHSEPRGNDANERRAEALAGGGRRPAAASGRASGRQRAGGGAEARRRGLVNIGNISASLLHRTDANDYEPVPEGRFTGKIRRLLADRAAC